MSPYQKIVAHAADPVPLSFEQKLAQLRRLAKAAGRDPKAHLAALGIADMPPPAAPKKRPK